MRAEFKSFLLGALLTRALMAGGPSGADLDLRLVSAPDPVAAGDRVAILVMVENFGPDDSTGSSLRIELPAPAAFTGSSGGCQPRPQEPRVVICPVAGLASEDRLQVELFAEIVPSFTGDLAVIADLFGEEVDADLDNNHVELPVRVVRETDLQVTKTDGVAVAVPGVDTLTYTIVAENAGPSDAEAVSVLDRLPSALDCSWTASATGGASGHSGGAGPALEALLSLPAGSRVTWTMPCRVDPVATVNVTNTVQIFAPSRDPVPANNTATDRDLLQPQADLEATLEGSSGAAVAGAGFTYTLEVVNNGPSAASALVVTLTLPPQTTFLEATAGCAVSTAVGVVTCPAGRLGVGERRAWSVEVAVPAAAQGTLTARATARSAAADPVPSPILSLTVPVAVEADLAVGLSSPTARVEVGGVVDYLVTAANLGPSDVDGAVVSDPFPAGLDCAWTSTAAGGATGHSDGAGELEDVLALPVGSTVSWAVRCSVTPDIVGPVINTARISLPFGAADPRPDDNQAAVTLPLLAADLRLTASAAPDPATPGGTVEWTLTVDNAGPFAAGGVRVVSDALPAGLDLQSTSGCAEDPAGFPRCSLGRLEVGAAATFTVRARIDPDLAGVVALGARAFSDLPEGDPGDESVSAPAAVRGEADLRLALAPPGPAAPGGRVVLDAELANDGPNTLAGARIAALLPPELALAATSCEGLRVAAGETVGCTVELRVAEEAEGTLEGALVARLPRAVTDPRLRTNRAPFAVRLLATSDLRVALVDPPPVVLPGKRTGLEIRVSNDGPSRAPEVTLFATLPFTDFVASCRDAAGLPCGELSGASELLDAFALAAGESRSYRLVGQLPETSRSVVRVAAELQLPDVAADPDLASNRVRRDLLVTGDDLTLAGSPLSLPGTGAPALALGFGEVLLVFEHDSASGGAGIAALVLDDAGRPAGGEILLSASPTARRPAVAFAPGAQPGGGGDDRAAPAAAMSSKGEGVQGAFLAVWEEGDPGRIFGRLIAGGQALGGSVEIGRGRGDGEHRPVVMEVGGSGFRVAWEDAAGGIFSRRVVPGGAIEAVTRLDADRPGSRRPALVPGSAVIPGTAPSLAVWDAPHAAGGDDRSIAGRLFDGLGTPVGEELLLTAEDASRLEPTGVWAAGAERFVVLWNRRRGALGGTVLDASGASAGEIFELGAERDQRPAAALMLEVPAAEDTQDPEDQTGPREVLLAVWERRLGGGLSVLMAQRLDLEGRPLGREFLIGGGGTPQRPAAGVDGFEPAVLFTPFSTSPAEFALVAWEAATRDGRQVVLERLGRATDLELTVAAEPAELPAEGPASLTYAVRVRHLGDVPAPLTVVAHQLQGGLALVASRGCREDPSAVTFCSLGTIQPGEEGSYELTVSVAAALAGPFDFTAEVIGARPDPDLFDNRVTVTRLRAERDDEGESGASAGGSALPAALPGLLDQ